jgi:hypothetical protein
MNKQLIEQMVRKELTKMLKEDNAADAIAALGGIKGDTPSNQSSMSASDALAAAFGDIKKDTSKLDRGEKETVYKKLILALKKALAGK